MVKRKQREQERRERNRKRLRRQELLERAQVYLDGKVYPAEKVEIRIGDMVLSSHGKQRSP